MEVTHQPYQAVPLDSKTSTRFLTLHHGSGEDAIKCSLTTVDLETKPPYKALSYCWGSPHNAKQLLLDEHFVDVRENLWSALWHLRFPHDDRILWVDALCINQSKISERNHQVGLMSTIYSKAEEVIAWLGPASEDSDVGMKWLSDFHRHIAPTLEEFRAAIKLCEREYWHRMWVLQEFGLAGDMTVRCGSKCVDWMAFAVFCTWIMEKDISKIFDDLNVPGHYTAVYSVIDCGKHQRTGKLDVPGHYTAVHSVIDYRIYQLTGMFDNVTLLALLAAFNNRQCADQRDTVFALLGMASDCRDLDPQFALIADYSQTLFSVYMNVFKISCGHLTRNGQRLDEGYQLGKAEVYSQVLQLFLQCGTAASPDMTRRFKSPGAPGCASKLFDLVILNENAMYEQAKKSLQECGEKEGIEEVLKWLEGPCSLLDTNKAIELFRQWPYDFPAAVRQIAKLQLFIAVYMRRGIVINTVGARTEILLSSLDRQCPSPMPVVMVDNNTGIFEVVGVSKTRDSARVEIGYRCIPRTPLGTGRSTFNERLSESK
ncbi:heterokaryon incompatibility protein-domain-containing protein [Hyaloscypha finlandica]|nr:heterokaryon incompatibility protein-domain-containing protein [Hyaloscypha finlandica]